jgi:hypothetical protein
VLKALATFLSIRCFHVILLSKATPDHVVTSIDKVDNLALEHGYKFADIFDIMLSKFKNVEKNLLGFEAVLSGRMEYFCSESGSGFSATLVILNPANCFLYQMAVVITLSNEKTGVVGRLWT